MEQKKKKNKLDKKRLDEIKKSRQTIVDKNKLVKK